MHSSSKFKNFLFEPMKNLKRKKKKSRGQQFQKTMNNITAQVVIAKIGDGDFGLVIVSEESDNSESSCYQIEKIG